MRNWWLHALPELAAQETRWKLRNKMNPEPMFAICGDSTRPGDRCSRGPAEGKAGVAGPQREWHAQPVPSQPYEPRGG